MNSVKFLLIIILLNLQTITYGNPTTMLKTEPESPEAGIHLFEERLSLCPVIIKKMLDNPVNIKLPILPENLIVTGIGSSKAHARFFVDLINRYTPSHASFLPLINFYKDNFANNKNTTLVVFSQALSPNAQLAMSKRNTFQHLILFTGCIDSSNELIQKLNQEKQTIIHYPVPEEKKLLIRILGPLCCYLSVIQFINHNWHNPIPECNHNVLLSAINKKAINPDFFLTHAKQGIIFLMGSPTSEYSQNLAYKFLEGLFLTTPTITDYLSLVHGTFQQLINNPKLILNFQHASGDKTLSLKANTIIEQTTSKILEISSDLPPPWDIFEYEMILNHLVLAGLKKWKIDQITWPGKGLDIEIYKISKPL